jgi:hypothetical protein
VIFSPLLFGPDVQIEEATCKLFAADAGVTYRGFSFDVEYYRRRIDNFTVRGSGGLPFAALHDSGFSLQASAMAVPKQVQVYAGASKVLGEYGDP